MSNSVTEIAAAPAADALRHFKSQFAYEADCWDVHAAMESADPGFVLIDARSPAMFDRGHVPGAVNIPHGKIIGSRLRAYADDTLFVVYCAGPHCNGAARAAVRLAELGRPVKLMVGGITGWLDEEFALEATQAQAEKAA